jgi:hypothetical protein
MLTVHLKSAEELIPKGFCQIIKPICQTKELLSKSCRQISVWAFLHRNYYPKDSVRPTSTVEKPLQAFQPCLWGVLTRKRERGKGGKKGERKRRKERVRDISLTLKTLYT